MATGGPSPIECGICMETFSPKERIPKCLPCGHTLCHICVERMRTDGHVICPNDKKKHRVPPEGIQGFITNHHAMGLLDYSCEQCQTLGPTSRCRHCPGKFCATCLDDHVLSVFKPEVKATLDRALSVKKQLQKELTGFVDRINKLIEDVDQFYVNSKEILETEVDADMLKEVQDKSEVFTKAMRELTDSCSIEQPRIDLTSFDRRRAATSSSKTVRFTRKSSVIRLSTFYSQQVKYKRVPRVVHGSKGSGPTEFKNPRAAAVGEHSRNIYVADQYNKRICVFENDCEYKSEYILGSEPRDICFTIDGNLAVTCDDDKVMIFDVSGNVTKTMNSKGKNKGEFDRPLGVTSDKIGMLYFCDMKNHRVQVLHKTGLFVRILGSEGPGKLEDPWSVAIHPLSGQVYVADFKKKQINIYNHDGRYDASIGKDDIPGISRFTPQYLSFRSDGLLCISDGSNRCVHLLKDGKVTQSIGEMGSAPGQFAYPLGTAFTDAGDLIVCDYGNHRLQIFSSEP